MIVVAVVLATLTALALAGLAWLLRLLRRDRALIWRPGDPLPAVPAGAALLTWQRARPSVPGAAGHAEARATTRPYGSQPEVPQ